MSRKAKERDGRSKSGIGYKFADQALLERALTHISALAGGNRVGSYQRLEFLGDHVLGLVISDMLYRAFPKANEGELSRRLADLVRKETCADVARAMELGPALKLGNSESHAGGRLRATILADACEALVGAVYLDGGYPAAEELVGALLERAHAQAAAPAARSQDHVAGMGAGARPADAGLPRIGAHRPASQSEIPRRGGAARPPAGRGPRPFQARRRTGRRRRHAGTGRRQAGQTRMPEDGRRDALRLRRA